MLLFGLFTRAPIRVSGLGQLKCLHRADVFKSADLFPSRACVGPNKVDLLEATLVCDEE